MQINPQDNNWLNQTGTLVRLIPKNQEAKMIITQQSHHWSIRPLPKLLREPYLQDVMQGWLYLRSMLHHQRFVHVLNDRLFDVVFETKDSVMAKRPIMPQPSQAKGNANV